MAQILCIGASTMYGVGGPHGGWPDYLKREFHAQQFDAADQGERHEVYNLAKPGVTIEFVIEQLPHLVAAYGRPKSPLVLCFTLGGNNARAVDTPENFVTSPEDFATKVEQLLSAAKEYTPHVLITGIAPVNEAVLNPKKSPWSGSVSYFFNQRQQLFDTIIADVATRQKAVCAPLYNATFRQGWTERYVWTDGLHPNADGHALLYATVRPLLLDLLTAAEA